MHPELHPFYQQLRLSSRKSPKRRSLCQVEWEAWAGWEAWAEWEGWCDDWHLKEKSDWLRCDSVIMKDINMVYDEQFILTRHRKQNKLGLQLVLWNMWRLYLVDWCDCMTVEAGSLHSRHLFHFHYRWSLFCKSAFEMMELFDIFINWYFHKSYFTTYYICLHKCNVHTILWSFFSTASYNVVTGKSVHLAMWSSSNVMFYNCISVCKNVLTNSYWEFSLHWVNRPMSDLCFVRDFYLRKDVVYICCLWYWVRWCDSLNVFCIMIYCVVYNSYLCEHRKQARFRVNFERVTLLSVCLFLLRLTESTWDEVVLSFLGWPPKRSYTEYVKMTIKLILNKSKLQRETLSS